jgi:hypothetical protein
MHHKSQEIQMKKTLLMLALVASGYAVADQNAVSGSISGAASQSGAASVSSPSNQQNINFNSPARARTTVDGTTDIRTVATVYAPPIGVTAPCYVGYSGGVTVVGFGASLGGGVEDVGCTLRETSRLLYGIGQTDAAARVMCANADAAKAMGPAICPEVAVVQPLPARAEVAPKKMAAATCYADSIVAARMNAPVCK